MRDEGRTQRQIADYLNAEGFATISGGKLWRRSAIQRICGYQRPRRAHRPAALPELPRRR